MRYCQLSLGVGFGASANEAGTNARAALRKSKEAGGNVAFIIREDQTLIGPLEMSDPVQNVLSPTDVELHIVCFSFGLIMD